MLPGYSRSFKLLPNSTVTIDTRLPLFTFPLVLNKKLVRAAVFDSTDRMPRTQTNQKPLAIRATTGPERIADSGFILHTKVMETFETSIVSHGNVRVTSCFVCCFVFHQPHMLHLGFLTLFQTFSRNRMGRETGTKQQSLMHNLTSLGESVSQKTV